MKMIGETKTLVETPNQPKITRKVTLEKENILNSNNIVVNSPEEISSSSQVITEKRSPSPTTSETNEESDKLLCDKCVQTNSSSVPIMEANSHTIVCASAKAANASPSSTDAAMALSSLARRAPFPNARRNFSWGPPPPPLTYYNSTNKKENSVPPRKNFCPDWSRQRPHPSAKETCEKQITPSHSVEPSVAYSSFKSPIQNQPNHSSYYPHPAGYTPLCPKLADYYDSAAGSNAKSCYPSHKSSPPSGQTVSTVSSVSVKRRRHGEEENHHIVTPTPKKMKLITTTTTSAPEESYSRKSKSLGLLCENFCKQKWIDGVIGIDGAAKLLGVERRRIYDIINILESLEIVERKCKNRYHWQGFKRLPEVLAQIQKEGVRDLEDEARKFGILKDSDQIEESTSPSTDQKTSSGTKKSLGRLSRQFLQLFLVGHSVMSLTEASDRIMGKAEDAVDQTNFQTSNNRADRKAALTRGQKTKIRRLYDIANVLASLV